MNQEDNYQFIELAKEHCELYFKIDFSSNVFLYNDIISHDYLGTSFKIEVANCSYDWQNLPTVNEELYMGEDINHGKRLKKFNQTCSVSFQIILNSILLPDVENKLVDFHAHSFEPFNGFSLGISTQELKSIFDLKSAKDEIKSRFKIVSVNNFSYPQNNTGFGFYADALRKNRAVQPLNLEVQDGYVYFEISDCHDEIQECLVNALFYEKYITNIMGGEQHYQGEVFYRPSFSYNDMQYLMWVSFGLDRLYSFWDRITFLLANYELGGVKNLGTLSFEKYFDKIENLVKQKKQISFNVNSKNLQWFFEFRNTYYSQIVKYRHRIVHYQITDTREGVLTAYFKSNAMEYTSKPNELKNLKLEYEGLGNLMMKHFQFCLEGFIRAVDLIEEIQ